MHSRCSALSLVLFSLCFYFSFSLSFASFLTSIFAPRMLPATCLEIGVAWAVPCACQSVCACVCVRVCVRHCVCVCVYIFVFVQIWLAYNNVVAAAVVAAAVAVASWRRRRRRLLTFCVGILTQLITAPPSDRTGTVCVGVCVRVVARLSHDNGDGWWQYLCKWSTAKATRSAAQAAAKSFSFIFGMCTTHTHTQHTHSLLFMLINCIAQFMHFIWIICIAIVNCKCDMQQGEEAKEEGAETQIKLLLMLSRCEVYKGKSIAFITK